MKVCSILLACVFLFVCCGVAAACTCGSSPTVCEAYAAAAAVFVGSVLSVQDEVTKEADGREFVSGQVARVQVEKVFKGIRETVAVFRSGRSSCDAEYKEGERWLFYAYYDKKSRSWGVRACDRSAGVEAAADDLLYLQGLPASAQKTRVAGTLTSPEDRPLSGVKVRLSNGRKSYEVYTDRNGIYEVYGLPPGKYVVKPEVPPYLKVRFSVSSEGDDYTDNQAVTVLLKEKSCAGVDYFFTDNTT